MPELGGKLITFAIPAGVFLLFLLSGFIFTSYLTRFLKYYAQKTSWPVDDIFVSSLGRFNVFIWFVLAGAYISLSNLPLSKSGFKIAGKTILVLFILTFTIFLAKFMARLISYYTSRKEGALPSTSIFKNLTYIIVYIIGFLMIFNALGISITPILTALGVGGLAVALALQDTLANLFAGFHIIASRQVRKGDYIKLDSGEEGYVVDITWRNTIIRALPNNLIIVPNSKLSSAIIVNFNLPEREMSVIVNVGVSYDSDLEKVERVTIEVAKEVLREVEGGVPEFEPFIRYHTFSDSSINFSVILRAKEFVNQYLIKHEFIKRLHRRYKEEGIEIPFPIRTVHLKELNK